MSKGMFRVMLVAVAVSVLAATSVFAADANVPAAPKPAPKPAPEPAPMMLKGVVNVVKDANGIVTAVKLMAEMQNRKMAHNVVLDKEGMELAKMDGKEVEAKVIRKGADFKVVSFKAVEKAAEKPAGKPAEKPKN